MKVKKATITIKIEVLDVESAPNLISRMMRNNNADEPLECLEGLLSFNDGDRIEWKTEFKDYDI